MTSMATNAGQSVATAYANGNDGYKAAKPAVERLFAPELNPSVLEIGQPSGYYLRVQKTVRSEQKIIGVRTRVHVAAYGLIDATGNPELPGPIPPVSPISPPAQTARPKLPAKAFAMHVEHLNFLKQVSMGERAPITPGMALLASTAWRLIWKTSGYKMPVPAAGTGPDGEMFYAWNAGRYHLELEIIPGQPAEFFYRDRETGEFWGEDYEVGEPLPAKIVSKLSLFQ